MTYRFGKLLVLLVTAAVAAFLLAGLPWPPGYASSPAPAERPAWLRDGIVMVGSWEPPTFQIRRGGQEVDITEQWKLERTEQSARRLKELGVTMVLTSLHKAAGLKAEAGEIEENRKFTQLAHQYGLKVGGYVGATIAYETFFAEEPDARNWIQTDEFGRPLYYNNDQTFRYVACRNNPGYHGFLERVLRLGVDDMKLDLIHFDQLSWWPEPSSCRCKYCLAEFREFLRTRYTGEQRKARYGFTLLDYLAPPPFNAPAGVIQLADLHNPLMQDWEYFRAASLARRFAEYDDYIRGMRPEVAVEGNPNINPGINQGFRSGIDYAQLLRTADILWSEEPNQASWTADGRLVSKIRSFKIARSMDRSLFVYTGGRYGAQSADSPPELRLAEAMAWNGVNLGMVGDLSANGTDLTPAAQRYVRFFHQHVKDMAGARSLANVAILRSFPSIEFNPARAIVSTILFEQTLIQSKVPFDIILDPQLKDLSRYKVLVLANQDALSDEAVNLIRAFVQNGGGLVATEDTSLLTDWRLRRAKFALADVFGVDRPPEPSARAQGHSVQHAFGAGRSVYIPRIEPSTPPPPAQINYDFGNRYWTLPKNYKNLVGAVAWAANDRLAAEIQAPLSVGAELAAQKGSNTWLLHLVNFDFTQPVRDIAVCLRTPAGMKVQKASVESPDFESRDALTTTVRDGVAFFRVPRLLVYDLVQVRLASQ